MRQNKKNADTIPLVSEHRVSIFLFWRILSTFKSRLDLLGHTAGLRFNTRIETIETEIKVWLKKRKAHVFNL